MLRSLEPQPLVQSRRTDENLHHVSGVGLDRSAYRLPPLGEKADQGRRPVQKGENYFADGREKEKGGQDEEKIYYSGDLAPIVYLRWSGRRWLLVRGGSRVS